MARTSISHFKKPNRFDVLRQDSIMSVPEEASSPVEAQPLLQHEEAGQVSQSAEVELATTKRDPLGQQLELRPSIQEESLYTEEAVSSRDVTEDLVTTNVAEQKEAESDDRMALARASQDDRPGKRFNQIWVLVLIKYIQIHLNTLMSLSELYLNNLNSRSQVIRTLQRFHPLTNASMPTLQVKILLHPLPKLTRYRKHIKKKATQSLHLVKQE